MRAQPDEQRRTASALATEHALLCKRMQAERTETLLAVMFRCSGSCRAAVMNISDGRPLFRLQANVKPPIAATEYPKLRFVQITELLGVTGDGWQSPFWQCLGDAARTPAGWLQMVADHKLGVCTSIVPCRTAATEDGLRINNSVDRLPLPRAAHMRPTACH